MGAAGAGAAGTEAAQEGTTAGGTTTLEKGVFGGGSGGELLEDSDFSVNTILKQLESIQQGSPKNIVILGTRHCSFLHQQIIELLSFALVLSDNHIFTSGATGTHAAAIRGALRAGNQELLTVILPQTIQRQPQEIRDLLGQARAPPPPSPEHAASSSAAAPPHRRTCPEPRRHHRPQVNRVIELGHDTLPLDAASRICNSELLSKGDQASAPAISRGKEFRGAAAARRPHSARHPPPPPLSPPRASLAVDRLRVPRLEDAARDDRGGEGDAAPRHRPLPRLRLERYRHRQTHHARPARALSLSVSPSPRVSRARGLLAGVHTRLADDRVSLFYESLYMNPLNKTKLSLGLEGAQRHAPKATSAEIGRQKSNAKVVTSPSFLSLPSSSRMSSGLAGSTTWKFFLLASFARE